MILKIEFEIELPDDIEFTQDELEAYLNYHYNGHGSISTGNPFCDEGEPEPIFGTMAYEFIN